MSNSVLIVTCATAIVAVDSAYYAYKRDWYPAGVLFIATLVGAMWLLWRTLEDEEGED